MRAPRSSVTAERIVRQAAVEDSTAQVIASAYQSVLEGNASWNDLLAARAALTNATDDFYAIEQLTDIPDMGRAVEEVHRLLANIPALPHNPGVADILKRITLGLEDLRKEIGTGSIDKGRWFAPPLDGAPITEALFQADPLINRALRWHHLARLVLPVIEPRVKIIVRCSIGYNGCTHTDCDHPRCARPGDVATVGLSEAKEMCALVACPACEGSRTNTLVRAGRSVSKECRYCGALGVVTMGAEPFDDEARQAIANHPDRDHQRRGTHSDAAAQGALFAAEAQRNCSRTRAGEGPNGDDDRRIRCTPEELPRVAAAVLGRAGLGSEGARSKSLAALTKRLIKIYDERISRPRDAAEANALEVICRRTKSGA